MHKKNMVRRCSMELVKGIKDPGVFNQGLYYVFLQQILITRVLLQLRIPVNISLWYRQQILVLLKYAVLPNRVPVGKAIIRIPDDAYLTNGLLKINRTQFPSSYIKEPVFLKRKLYPSFVADAFAHLVLRHNAECRLS